MNSRGGSRTALTRTLRGRMFHPFGPEPHSPRFLPLAGCGKTLQCSHSERIRCHSERSEGSRSEHFQGNARFFVAAAPQNDSAFGFFRSLLGFTYG